MSEIERPTAQPPWQAERLVFLDGDREAQRLLVAWPRAGDGVELDDLSEELYAELLEQWAASSGVPHRRTEQIASVLISNGLCGSDGYVPPQALRFVRAEMARRLAKGKAK